jgi:hypothetical protein
MCTHIIAEMCNILMCVHVLHPATAVQVAEYKYEIERLTRELAGLKKKYFEAKKREQLDKEAARGAAAAAGALGSAAGLMGMLGAAGGKTPPGGQQQQQQQQSQQQRFTGGGFSLSTVVG